MNVIIIILTTASGEYRISKYPSKPKEKAIFFPLGALCLVPAATPRKNEKK